MVVRAHQTTRRREPTSGTKATHAPPRIQRVAHRECVDDDVDGCIGPGRHCRLLPVAVQGFARQPLPVASPGRLS
jgi:hypothetical protein